MIATDISADTRRLADLLAEVPRSGVITFGTMSGAIGRDVLEFRHLIYGALRVAEREFGAVFASERGTGYRRLPPDEIVRIGQTARARIRRTARSGARSLTAGMTGANDIDPAMRRRILSEQTTLGLLEHIARDKNLAPVPEHENRPLPLAVAAKEFLRMIGATG